MPILSFDRRRVQASGARSHFVCSEFTRLPLVAIEAYLQRRSSPAEPSNHRPLVLSLEAVGKFRQTAWPVPRMGSGAGCAGGAPPLP